VTAVSLFSNAELIRNANLVEIQLDVNLAQLDPEGYSISGVGMVEDDDRTVRAEMLFKLTGLKEPIPGRMIVPLKFWTAYRLTPQEAYKRVNAGSIAYTHA